jgi:mono/diheme cytochrome c family protein
VAVIRSWEVLTLLTALLVAHMAWAAGDTTDVSVGRSLALNWCAQCHLVAEDQDDVPFGAGPSFYSIADHPATTEMRLRAFLISPHPIMPNIMLSQDQIDEIVAYILSLRERQP